MPSLFKCPSCGKQCWNLKPYLSKATANALYGCSVYLVDGKYCPHCGKLSSFAPPPEVYQKRLEEEKDGKL